MENLLLNLVRLAANGAAPEKEDSLFAALSGLDEKAWHALFEAANTQGVAAFIWDAMEPAINAGKLAMPKELMLQWAGLSMGYEQRYLKYTLSIGKLASLLATEGIKMMILKGYAASLDWPVPAHRPSGDIDIWNFGEQQRADALVASKGGKVDDSHHHHTVFHIGGFMVENHYDFINVYAHRSSAQIEKKLKELARADAATAEVPCCTDGSRMAKVYLPPVQFNALFLIVHLAAHFGGEEIHLRQVLDWAFFVKKYGSQIDWAELQADCRHWNKIQLLDSINAICADYLGFGAADFPVSWRGTRDEAAGSALAKRVLGEILEPEFKEPVPHGAGLLKSFAFRWRRWRANSWKNRMVYPEGELATFLRQVWSHLLKPKSIYA